MNTRTLLVSATVLGIWVGCPVPADAHRLDEYLQVTRLSIDRERLRLEIDLTAGISVAGQVFTSIDTDHDGQVSIVERSAYAREVLRSIALSIDGRPTPIVLEDSEFPDILEMSLGVGTICLRATATVPSAAAAIGHHTVSYANNHRPVASVYLVNALVPADSRVEIGQPHRDVAQRALRLDYSVLPDVLWMRLSWSLVGLATVGLLACARWRCAPTRSCVPAHWPLTSPRMSLISAHGHTPRAFRLLLAAGSFGPACPGGDSGASARRDRSGVGGSRRVA
jgi:hypothetical protein